MSKISIIDTIRGLSGLIESLFGEPPTTKDITEGFTRPTTYIQPVYSETAREGELQHDTHELELIRFGERTRAGYLSLLEWEAKLRRPCKSRWWWKSSFSFTRMKLNLSWTGTI